MVGMVSAPTATALAMAEPEIEPMPAEDAEELLGAVEDEYGGEHAAQAEQGNIPETLVIQGPFDSFDHIRPPWLLPGAPADSPRDDFVRERSGPDAAESRGRERFDNGDRFEVIIPNIGMISDSYPSERGPWVID